MKIISKIRMALKSTITAIDLDDKFGDDIDSRHEAEEDAHFQAMEALRAMRKSEFGVLVIHGDIEPESIVWCEDEDEAHELIAQKKEERSQDGVFLVEFNPSSEQPIKIV